MATLNVTITRDNAVIGYGYSGSADTPYFAREFFKVGRQGSGAVSKAAITILDESVKALQGKGYRINNAYISAYAFNNGNEWQTSIPVRVDGCTTEEVTTATTYNTLPTADVEGVNTTVSSWSTWYDFDITNVMQAICSNASNAITLLLYQTTTANSTAKAFYVTNASYYIKLTVDYDIPEILGTPQNVALDKTKTKDFATLSWLAVTDGLLNTVEGYEIQRRDNGGTWASLTSVGTVESEIVSAPAQGITREYRIRALGSAGALYFSEWAVCPQTLSLLSGGKAYISGAWVDTIGTLAYINGAWRTVTNKKTFANGNWQDII